MKLENLISNLSQIDDNLVIFQKDKLDIDSEIALFGGEEAERTILTKKGVKYFYLLEVDLTKEFISDWVNSLQTVPTEKEIAQRLFEYGVNDA